MQVTASHGHTCQVGGGKDGGIMVREGWSLKSPESLDADIMRYRHVDFGSVRLVVPRLRQRLATGSLVRELAEKGERICHTDVFVQKCEML